ncbi:MAG: hypothetical protein K0A89_01865 [ANME-2 cluster archaeon]|nr:hypothetical protein [ANME-2 cluster archaeon]
MKVSKTVYLFAIACIFLTTASPGCIDSSNTYLETQNNWTAHKYCLSIDKGPFMRDALLDDPCVIKENSAYVMYLTGNMGSVGQDVVPYRATSNDGMNWEINPVPLLSKGNTGNDFDFARLESPSVVFFKGMYHMYYTGVNSLLMGERSIGHATSTDGIKWSKVKDNPMLTPSGNFFGWNASQVAEPGVLVFNDKVYLYFSAVGLQDDGNLSNTKRTIGLAISDDGYYFGSPIKVLEQGPLYPPHEGYLGYSTPAAVIYEGEVHLFYDVFMKSDNEVPAYVQVALHHAVSPDGIKNWVEDEDPIFTRDSFSWSKREVRAPTVIVDEGRLKMWFAGDDYLEQGTFCIGYATYEG